MKSLIFTAGFATLLGGSALAQTATPAAPDATTTTPATGAMTPAPDARTTAPAANTSTTRAAPAAGTTGGAFYTLPAAPAAGGMPMNHLASDLADMDVYGANNEKIGEIDDLIVNSDGTVAAAVVEVGGFLGMGERDVLVNFSSLQMAMDGDNMRISVPELTKETLTSAPEVDLDATFPDRD
jgi:sporulation protein YlmC with PRC-barrel domain